MGNPVFWSIAWSPEVWTCKYPALVNAFTASFPEIFASFGMSNMDYADVKDIGILIIS